MRVLIVGFQSKNYTPFLAHYEAILTAEDVAFDTVFWERDEGDRFSSAPGPAGTEYSYRDATGKNVSDKTWRAVRYMRRVRQLMDRKRYDRLVVLTTEPAFFLSRRLLGEYAGRYLFDYRDVTFERLAPFRHRIDRVIARSYATFFSSEGFARQFSPHDTVHLVHNVAHDVPVSPEAADLRQRHPVGIGFIGFVRYPRENESLITALADNPAYTLSYAGTAFRGADLGDYARRVGARNVTATGHYLNTDKPRLYASVDIINAIYSLDAPEVRLALPNKLYDAALYKKPILATRGTYLAEVVEERGLGLAVDPLGGDVAHDLDAYVAAFEPAAFAQRCEAFLADVAQDMAVFEQTVAAFVRTA